MTVATTTQNDPQAASLGGPGKFFRTGGVLSTVFSPLGTYKTLNWHSGRCSKTDASPRTVYLTPIAMAHLDAIRPDDADGSEPVFGLSVASISRRGQDGRPGGRLHRPFRAGGDGAAHGPRRRAPTHEIMAQGRWKSAGLVDPETPVLAAPAVEGLLGHSDPAGGLSHCAALGYR